MAALTICSAVLAAILSLAPRGEYPLPDSMGAYATDVALESPRSAFISTERGVFRFSPSAGTAEMLVAAREPPAGVPYPAAIATNGETLVVASFASHSWYSMALRDRKRLIAQRSLRLVVSDVALHAGRACLIAFAPDDRASSAAAFCGPANRPWSEYQPLHRLQGGESAKKIFRASEVVGAGWVVAHDDGSMSVATTAEPGVYHYAPDGTLREVLGRSLDQFVLDAMPEAQQRFAMDVENRFRLVLNAQPIIDDLVATPRGPALVIRTVEKQQSVHWDLLWPRRDGGAGPPLRLGIEGVGPRARLRCAAKGSVLACIGQRPPRTKPYSAEQRPYLWIFELPK